MRKEETRLNTILFHCFLRERREQTYLNTGSVTIEGVVDLASSPSILSFDSGVSIPSLDDSDMVKKEVLVFRFRSGQIRLGSFRIRSFDVECAVCLVLYSSLSSFRVCFDSHSSFFPANIRIESFFSKMPAKLALLQSLTVL